MKNTICPYTLQPIATIQAGREHVIPDALGSPNGFAVSASIKANNQFGSTIDVALVESDMVRMCSTRLGLRTRSGPSRLKLRGNLTSDSSEVDLKFSPESVDVRLRSPIVKDESDEIVGVRGYGDDAWKELGRISSDFAKKGKTVQAGSATPIDGEVLTRVSVNARDIGQGLLKIAYLTNVWLFGDDFIQGGVAAIFRDCLTDSGEVAPRLATSQMDYAEIAACVPALTEAHHMLACVRSDGQITTVVRLFNNDLLSANFTIPADSAQARNTTSLDLIAVDTRDRSFEQLPTICVNDN